MLIKIILGLIVLLLTVGIIADKVFQEFGNLIISKGGENNDNT